MTSVSYGLNIAHVQGNVLAVTCEYTAHDTASTKAVLRLYVLMFWQSVIKSTD